MSMIILVAVKIWIVRELQEDLLNCAYVLNKY